MSDRRMATVERTLGSRRRSGVFSKDMVASLPAAAGPYLLHAIAPGTPVAGSVQLETVFSMKLSPGARQPTVLIGISSRPRLAMREVVRHGEGGGPLRRGH
jgi:hypothetical protein